MYRKKRQQLQNIFDVAGAPFGPGDIDVERAHRKVVSRLWGSARREAGWLVCLQRVAAILILPLITALTYLLIAGYGSARDASSSLPVLMEANTPYGMYTRMNLPDGSTVWLNAGSRLEYPAVFASGERRVYLSGEGYFEVGADAGKPFLVETADITVRATGTAFDVEAYPGDTVTCVTMVEGRVSVGIGDGQPLSISPGERMEYNHSCGRYAIRRTDTYKWCAWKDGKMVFRDDPLEYVFKKIGQTFNVEIVMNDASIGRHPYRATFEGESLDQILRLLRMTAPITYKYFDRKKDMDNHFLKQRIEVSSRPQAVSY
jgi:ferric-dicitrate binding protein FerR (iron transport regulator)